MEKRSLGSWPTSGLERLVDCLGRMDRRTPCSLSQGHSWTGWGRSSGRWCGSRAAAVLVAAAVVVAAAAAEGEVVIAAVEQTGQAEEED